ncbi:hypothetical protein RKD26_004047 [Streptomyces calvus]
MPVVEGGDQADVLAEQHAVAEHVTGHVADADDGEVLGLGVHAQLPEVPLDGLPGAAGGDAHALVVVAGAAAGGERVAEPEVVGLGDLVGDVREGRGALVGGDDEVGVVLVVPDDVRRGHDLAGHHVVGDVEQRRDERPVGGDALRHPRVAVHGRVGQLLGDEAALGADRHDDGVLHHLRLDQAEDLGAEVLAAVRPAQATARDLAEPQVHALDARRVHPDLERRARRREVGDGLRVELHGDVVVRRAVARLLEEVRAQRRLDDGEEGTQDAVLVQRGHLVQGGVDLLQQRVHQFVAGALPVRRHPRLEQGDEQPCGVDVGAEGVLHVVLAEGGTGLAQVLGVRAQHHGLAPGQPGAQHQGVEAVVLRLAGPGRREGVLEPLTGVVAEVVGAAGRPGHAQAEVVDPGDAAVGAAQLVGPLVDDLDAEPLEDRQHRGEGDGLALAVDLEAALLGARAHRLVQAEREVPLLAQLFEAAQVGDGAARGVVGLVALGEGAGVAAQQLGGALLAELGVQSLGEAVGPGAGGLDEPGLDALLVGVGQLGQFGALRDADHEVQPGEDRLGVPGGEVDAGAAEFLLEDVDDPQPDTGGVAVARQVDEGRVVAPVLVLAQVEPQPAALLEVEHRGDDGLELADRGLEQLVARVGLQDLEQVAAVVAVRREAGALQDLLDLAPDHRHPAHGLGVGGGREQAEEAPLTDDVAVRVELLDADVVQVRRPVHGGPAVGLGQHQQLVLARLRAGVGGQPLEGRADRVALVGGVVRVGAQDAQAGAGDGAQRVVLAQLVLAVAEEGEVVVGEPAQQLAGLLDLRRGQVGGHRLVGQRLGQPGGGLAHLAPVLDGLADVGQDPQQVGGDLLEVAAVGLAVDLHMDPGLDVRVVRQVAAGRGGEHLDQLAGDVPADHELRVHDDVDAAALAGQLIGDGVDQERHVVGDDLDDGVAARPAVLLDGRGVHADVGGALGTALGEPVVRDGGSEDVDRVAVGEVLRGGVQVVALEEREHGFPVGCALVRRPSR